MPKEFNLDVFSLNLAEAIKYIKVSKAINEKCRYRVETNKNSEAVKVYTIRNGKIIIIAGFKDGNLANERKVDYKDGRASKD